jgi:hypothetical protein
MRDTSATANPRGAGACVLVSHFPQRRGKRMCHMAAPHPCLFPLPGVGRAVVCAATRGRCVYR